MQIRFTSNPGAVELEQAASVRQHQSGSNHNTTLGWRVTSWLTAILIANRSLRNPRFLAGVVFVQFQGKGNDASVWQASDTSVFAE